MAKEIEPTTDEKDINPKWAKFVIAYTDTGNAYQSAIQAGFSVNYATVITSRIPDKVRKSLNEALEAKGVSSTVVAEKIRDMMFATRPNWQHGKEGWVNVGDEPDYHAIDKGVTHAIKIGVGGGYAPDKQVILNLDGTLSERESELADRLIHSQRD